ncbi:WxL protein peptidoglycan domain-containing protein, partial [Pseudomonadota bacterium]
MKNKINILVRLLVLTALTLLINANIVLANAQVAITVKNPDPYTGNQSWFVYTKEPGTIIEDVASIKNFSNVTTSVKVYAVDATSSESGSFILKFDTEKQTSIGKWAQVEQKEFELAPGERMDVPFKIEVPMDIGPGQYLGGIVVTNGSKEKIDSDKDCETDRICQTSIGINTRVGSRIYLTVPGEPVEDVIWEDFRYAKNLSGKSYFSFKIINNGNVSYEPKAHVTIYDAIGGIYDEFTAPLGTSLPNTNIDSKIAWTKEAPIFGKFTAEARIEYPKRFHSKTAAKLQG